MRRFVLLSAVLALLAPAPAEAAKPAHSWAQAEIKLVVSRGLMADSVASFKPNAPLTQTHEFNIDRNNIGPRVGAAWQIDEDTVLRASTGIMIDRAGDDRAARCPARSSAGTR